MDQFIPVAGPSQDDFDTMSDHITQLLYAGNAATELTTDLNKYRHLEFVNGYGQIIPISHNFVANEELHGMTGRYYSSSIPLVVFSYNFQTSADRSKIFIDTANSKQVNINSDGTITEVSFNNEMKFIKVYGTDVIGEG